MNWIEFYSLDLSPLKATFLVSWKGLQNILYVKINRSNQCCLQAGSPQHISKGFARSFHRSTRSISWGQRTPADCTMTASARKTPNLIWELTLTHCVGLGKPLNLSTSQLFLPINEGNNTELHVSQGTDREPWVCTALWKHEVLHKC